MKLEQSDKAIIFANTQIPDIFLAEYLHKYDRRLFKDIFIFNIFI